jgi:hypothetical protein
MAGQKPRWKPRIVVSVMVAAGVLLFVIANVHLVHVAFTSQPDCVPHLKTAGDTSGSYRAARSAC